MMRRIGFGMRFSALVIDIAIIITIVFGIYFLAGDSLIDSLGVMNRVRRTRATTPSSAMSTVIRPVGQAAQTTPNRSNTQNQSQSQSQSRSQGNNQQSTNTDPQNPTVRQSRSALPGATEPQTNQFSQQQSESEQVRRQREREQAANKTPRGYIHNSKDFVKIFFFCIITILYFLTEGMVGFSVGKFIMRLKIFRNNRDKTEKAKLLLRVALKIAIPCFIIFIYSLTKARFFWLFGMVWLFLVTVGCFFVFSNTMQTLHDRLTDTAVFSLRLKEQEDLEEEVESA